MEQDSLHDHSQNDSGENSISANNMPFEAPGSVEVRNEVQRDNSLESNSSSASSVSIRIMNNDSDSRTQSPTTPLSGELNSARR